MISGIRLQRYRSYRDEVFEFEPGVNIIVGPNGSGKTNLLEAILVGCQGGSYRAKDPELVAFGAPWARIDMYLGEQLRTVKLIVQDNGAIKKEFVVGGQRLSRLHLSKTIPVVLFEPNHLLLLHGSPDARRDYLDSLLEQLLPGYGKVRRDYRRILVQRNALLKHGPGAKKQLFAWNVRLSETGALVAQERALLAKKIGEQLNGVYQSLADSARKSVSLMYEPFFSVQNYSSSLLKALEDQQDKDIERGFTSLGPHREDFTVSIDGRIAAEVASRGETRTVLLALKIIELSFIEEVRQQKPLLLLDDVFSELDGKRRKALTQALIPYQTFITTTDADIIQHHFTDRCHVIPLDEPRRA